MTLSEIASLDSSPIVFVEKNGEYYLEWTEIHEDAKTRIIRRRLIYDPFTGEKLPIGKNEASSVVDKSEIESLKAALKKMRSVEDIMKKFGKPNKIRDRFDRSKQYDYKTVYKTIDFSVYVSASGEISASFVPKRKD